LKFLRYDIKQENLTNKKTSAEREEALFRVFSGGSLSKENRGRHSLNSFAYISRFENSVNDDFAESNKDATNV